MTQPPDYIAKIPATPAIHNEPPKSAQWRGMSQDQVSSLQKRLLESIIQVVVQAITGIFIPGGGVGGASNQLQQWATDTATSISTWIGNVVDGWNHFWDGIFGTSGTTGTTAVGVGTAAGAVSSTANTAGANANTALGNIITIVTNIVNQLGGQTGTWSVGNEAQPLADAAANIASLNAAVAALQQQGTANGNSGKSVIIDFSTYASTTNLPASFTQSYSGSGTDPLGVYGGRVRRAMTGNNTARSTTALYNVFVTNTDYQLIPGIWTVKPSNDGLGNRSYFYLNGRVNSADTSKVYVKFGSDSAELGCYVAGVKTTFTVIGNGGSGTFSFKAGALYILYTGTIGGLRIFQLTENGIPIITYSDGSSVSQAGASYRGGGMAAEWPTSLGNMKPGELMVWGLTDNAFPTIIGSGARMYRSSATDVNVSSGVNLFPASFFDTDDIVTSDITMTSSSAKFQVANSGWYSINAHVSVGAGWPNAMALLLYKGTGAGSSSAWEYGGPDTPQGRNNIGGAQIPRWIHGHWDVYLGATDYVQLAYDATGAATNAIDGEATGLQSYFTISLANRSLN